MEIVKSLKSLPKTVEDLILIYHKEFHIRDEELKLAQFIRKFHRDTRLNFLYGSGETKTKKQIWKLIYKLEGHYGIVFSGGFEVFPTCIELGYIEPQYYSITQTFKIYDIWDL